MTGRHFDEAERSCSSPSSGSSHGEGHAADTEMDAAGPSGASGAENPRQTCEKRRESDPPAQPPPAKKKRTRTLTTPHQSAVLHALLAQSRFPTTAMREEVGRSIGLSARKVQVWFQNQRQKARRPRNQDSVPLTRPPQYGAFPNVLSLTHSVGGASVFQPSEGQAFYMAPPAPFIRFHASQDSPSREDAIGSSATGTRTSPIGHLSGPGVPGATSPLAPRFPPISPSSQPPHPWPSSNDGHPGAPPPVAAAVPLREFTFSVPFPPLHVPEASPSPHYSQTRFPALTPPTPTLTPGHHYPAAASSPPPSPFAATAPEPHPYTPGPFLAQHQRHHRGFEQARLTPTRHIPPPLYVPETPPHSRRRPGMTYTSARDSRPVVHFPHSATSGSSRGGSPPVSVRPRVRRFDPVREAASERSASQGTDKSTPPRVDTPHV